MDLERIGTFTFLLIISLAASRRFKTVVNPVVVVCAPWATMLLAQQFLAPVFLFSWTAALMIWIAVLAFVMGATIVWLQYRGHFQPVDIIIARQPNVSCLWNLVSFTLVGLAMMNFVLMLYYGYGLGVGRVPGGGLVSYAVIDAIQASELGWFQRGLQTGTYVGATIFAFETSRLRRPSPRVILFLGLVVGQSWMISNRLPVFIVISIFLLVWAMVFARAYSRLSTRMVLVVALVLVLGAGFNWLTTARRHGQGPDALASAALAADLLVTFFGPPAAFSAYLDTSDDWRYGVLSGITIRGPLEMLALAERGWGWDEPVVLSTLDLPIATNVFTGLAMLLIEVGVLGMAAVMMVLGIVTTALFYSLYGRPSMLKAAALVNLYVLLLWLPIALQTYYVFWYVNFIAGGVLGIVFFRARHAIGASRIVHMTPPVANSRGKRRPALTCPPANA